MKNYILFALLFSLSFLFSCEKTNEDIFNGVFTKGELGTTEIKSITSIRDTTTTLNCVMSFKGKGYLLARGVCWSTTQHPTIDNGHVTVKDTGTVTLKMSKLTPGTLYYVRPFITNNEGTAYGTELSFTTKTIPTITIATSPTNLTAISATITGTISNDGGDSVTVRGVCWGTSTKPTVALNTKTTNGVGKGTFNADLSGLTIGTTYFARTYATNAYGTAYSSEISFTTQNLPTLSTTAVSNITTVTATSGGTITNDGGSAIIVRGVCWSTSQNPTNDLTTKTNESIGIGTFSSTLVNLQINTTYYVRAYATNSVGTSYGAQQTFTTNGYATLTTNSVSAITSTTATCGGNISSSGGSSITARGVCWSTSTNPTISDSKTSDATGTGTFTSSITGLSPGTTYYVRAYVSNTAGTQYGSNVSFTTTSVLPTVTTTAISAITTSTASSGGNVTSDGGATITTRGVCWSTSSTPTISNSKTSDGTGVGAFTSSITGLAANTTYYVRAYATNSVGTAYGSQISFTTSNPTLATIITNSVSSITSYTASCDCTITNDGGSIVYERGICWNTSTNPTINNNAINNGTGIGSFTCPITGFASNTTYYVRGYAKNSVGVVYGLTINFTTLSILLPIITTSTISVITTTSASTGGNVTSEGGGIVSARGVCWSTSSIPTINNSKTSDGTGIGSFTSSISGLTPNTTYYVRAYATNIGGTAYGNQMSLTTNAVLLPILTTVNITSITSSTATSGGSITSDGGGPITARGVCWSTSSSPTISNSKTTDGTGTGSYGSSINGLTPNTTYYLRAYATNIAGTAYGDIITFKTNNLAIGDLYLGGKVAYLDDSGIHGFVCTLTDQSTIIQWYNGTYVNLNPAARNEVLETSGVYGITKSGGRKNTDAIIAAQGTGSYAASICAALTIGGSTAGDWYLPSKGELNQLYINSSLLGGFNTGNYWSSTMYYNMSYYSAYNLCFLDGSWVVTDEKNGLSVRAIRAF